MNILCVIDSLGPGGAQRQLVELGLGFREKGNSVSFLVYHNILFFNKILENKGISITCIEETNYVRRIFKMRRFIRTGGYDAVLSFLEGSNFICEIAGLPYRRWRLVVGERSSNPEIKTSLRLRMYRWFHLFADYIVANSHANLKLVRSANFLLQQSRCKVIYNLVDFDKWNSQYDAPIHNGKKLKIVIGSNHTYPKNSNGLIEALALMKKEELEKISV